MSNSRAINDHIRRHLRRLRKSRGLTALELARRIGLPRTTYVSLETGAYQLKLDLLHRALAVLEADISDVWPNAADTEEDLMTSHQVLRAQQFRLRELIGVCHATGGSLFSKTAEKVTVHLACEIAETELERIVFYLEDGRLYRPGSWFSRKSPAATFLLYLQNQRIPKQSGFLIRHYLVIWEAFFESSVSPQTSD